MGPCEALKTQYVWPKFQPFADVQVHGYKTSEKSRTYNAHTVCVLCGLINIRATGRTTNNKWPNRCVHYIAKTRVELCLSIRFVIGKRAPTQRDSKRESTDLSCTTSLVARILPHIHLLCLGAFLFVNCAVLWATGSCPSLTANG